MSNTNKTTPEEELMQLRSLQADHTRPFQQHEFKRTLELVKIITEKQENGKET